MNSYGNVNIMTLRTVIFFVGVVVTRTLLFGAYIEAP